MTIYDSLTFSYNGIQSYDMGLYNVSINGGLFEEDVTGQRSIEEDRDIAGNRYLKDVDEQPLEFSVSFYFYDKFDRDKIRKVTRWLMQKEYKPLIFNNHPDRILYAVPIGSYRLIHNGLEEGYLSLSFRCDTHHFYSPSFQSEMFDLSSNDVEGTVIDFENKGDMDTQPIIYITKVGNGDVSFINLSNEGKEMKISNLVDGEQIKIDCSDAELETNSGFNRYNDFNFNWLNLIYGVNRIKILGNCTFYYICRFNTY